METLYSWCEHCDLASGQLSVKSRHLANVFASPAAHYCNDNIASEWYDTVCSDSTLVSVDCRAVWNQGSNPISGEISEIFSKFHLGPKFHHSRSVFIISEFFLLFHKNQINSINQQLVEKSKHSYLWTDFARVWSISTSGSIRKRTEISVWPWRSMARSLKVKNWHYTQNVRNRMGNIAAQVEWPSESRSRSSKVKNIIFV